MSGSEFRCSKILVLLHITSYLTCFTVRLTAEQQKQQHAGALILVVPSTPQDNAAPTLTHPLTTDCHVAWIPDPRIG